MKLRLWSRTSRQGDTGDIKLTGHQFGEQQVAGLGELRVLQQQCFDLLK